MPYLPEMTDEEQGDMARQLRELAEAVADEKPISCDIRTQKGGGGFERVEIAIEWRETPPLTVQINNGPAVKLISLEVTEGAHFEMTMLPQPDPGWERVDSNGHYHAYSDGNGDSYPTLASRTIHHGCDGSCGGVCEGEGYTSEQLSCRICNEVIYPRMTSGPHRFAVPKLSDWSMEVPVAVTKADEVSVRFSDGRFGVAVVTEVRVESRGFVRTRLAGNGLLGVHK